MNYESLLLLILVASAFFEHTATVYPTCHCERDVRNLYDFAFAFYCLIQSNCIAVINLQAPPKALEIVGLLVCYRRRCFYDALDNRMFESLFIVVSIALFIIIKSLIVS